MNIKSLKLMILSLILCFSISCGTSKNEVSGSSSGQNQNSGGNIDNNEKKEEKKEETKKPEDKKGEPNSSEWKPQYKNGLVDTKPGCTENGCLKLIYKVGDFKNADIQQYAPPGQKLDNGYSIFSIQFKTFPKIARATVLIPIPEKDTPTKLDIVVNNHGTSGLNNNCALGSSAAGAALAGTFGARGLIGVALDYPGLGTEGVHPYLIKEVEGKASLDAARATISLMEFLKRETSSKVAIVGLSQGGHATFSAAQYHENYAPEIDIRAFGIAAPSSVYKEHWTPAINYPGDHLVFYAFLAYAWDNYYNLKNSEIWADGLRKPIHDIMNNNCIWAPTGGKTVGQLIGKDPKKIFSKKFLDEFSSGILASFPSIEKGFKENRVTSFKQTAPIRVYQGNLDTTVPQAGTNLLVNNLKKDGMDIEYIVVTGGSHLNVAFGFMNNPELKTQDSIKWIKELMTKENPFAIKK